MVLSGLYSLSHSYIGPATQAKKGAKLSHQNRQNNCKNLQNHT